MRALGYMMAASLFATPVAGWSKEVPQQATEAVPIDIGSWIGPDNYPPEAIRAGEQGRVVAIVSIDAAGHPTACRIDVSIGSPALERGTCATVLANGRFEPARDARGRAIASEMTLPIRWVLPSEEDTRPPSGPWDTIHIITIDADDTVLNCKVTVNGKPQSTTLADCGRPGGSPAELRERLKITGRYSMRMDVAIRHGDTPPPVPPIPLAGRLLASYEARQIVDAEGVPSGCTVTVIAGEQAEEARKHLEKTPCERGVRFFPPKGSDGTPKAANVLIATWITLLPASN